MSEEEYVDVGSADVPFVKSGRPDAAATHGILGMFGAIDSDLVKTPTAKPAMQESFNRMPMTPSGHTETMSSATPGQGYSHPNQHNPNAFGNDTGINKQDIHNVWKLADSIAPDLGDDDPMYGGVSEEKFGLHKTLEMIRGVSKSISDEEDIVLWLQCENQDYVSQLATVGKKIAKQLNAYADIALKMKNKNRVG